MKNSDAPAVKREAEEDWSKERRRWAWLRRPTGQDRIMIYGPKSDGTYIIDLGYTTERILKFSAHLGADPA